MPAIYNGKQKKKNDKSRPKEKEVKRPRTYKLGELFDEHLKCESQKHDVHAVMKTMVREPYIHHVPTLTGGIGYLGVHNFYKDEFINRMPKDTKLVRISRTIGKDQVVDELVLNFTHDREIDFMLPRVPPTGKHVELPHIIITKFNRGKIEHKHIYWDQASLLAQIGLLDPQRLPVAGIEQARMLLELTRETESRSATGE
ncbi:MAG: ester cyclase [Thermoproteota archaeon]|jgi:carboxymethylenebutenolidase|nr:ester cyclase [Thermoproteota archaeon]